MITLAETASYELIPLKLKPVQDTDAQSHERGREVNSFLSFVCDGEVGDRHVRFLGKTAN